MYLPYAVNIEKRTASRETSLVSRALINISVSKPDFADAGRMMRLKFSLNRVNRLYYLYHFAILFRQFPFP